MTRAIVMVGALVAGCQSTSGAILELPVVAAGGPRTFTSSDGWSVELETADVAFGPFWGCSTDAAEPSFCPEAVIELRETIVVDAIDPELRMLALAPARQGSVSTGMWDYGISWLPTAGRPAPNAGAPDGHSARFRGRAEHADGRTFSFVCDADLVPIMRGALVATGRRIGPHDIEGPDDALIVRVDATAWWRGLAFEQLWLLAEEGGTAVLPLGHAQYDALLRAIEGGTQPDIAWGRGE